MRRPGCPRWEPTRSGRSRSSRAASCWRTFSGPIFDRFNYERDELEAKIHVALAGRCAEESFGEPSIGAESDLQQLTEIARQMVGRWGMSERIGPCLGAAEARRPAAPAGYFRNLAGLARPRRRRGAANRGAEPRCRPGSAAGEPLAAGHARFGPARAGDARRGRGACRGRPTRSRLARRGRVGSRRDPLPRRFDERGGARQWRGQCPNLEVPRWNPRSTGSRRRRAHS